MLPWPPVNQSVANLLKKDQKTAFYVSNLNLKGMFEEAFMQGVFKRSGVKDLGGDVDEETTINLLRFFYQKKKNF